jgi:hypothetical protein
MYVAICSDTNASQSCTSNGDGSQTCTISCSAMEWGQAPGLLPPLSVADGTVISLAIGGVWAIAFGARMLRRFVAK